MPIFLWDFDIVMNERNMVVEIQCSNIHFDRTMKSPSDFYRKLSNGKMSLGGPQQTNRSWWNRSISGGAYSYRKTDEVIEILFNVELKSENVLGVKLQFLSRIKKMLPFSTVRIGGEELMENHTERFVTNEQGYTKGTQFIGNKYNSPNCRI
jgi:predicted RND superfamily exporter protein